MPKDGLGEEKRDEKPFISKNRRTVCENAIWRVCLDHVIEEGVAEIPDYLVLELKAKSDTPRKITGSVVLPIVGGRICLLRIYRHAVGESFWETPRGLIEKGEDVVAGAMRELEEETGLRCPPQKMLPLGFICPEASTIAGRASLFAAEDCEFIGQARNDELGFLELRLFSFDEVRRMANEFAIEDAGTIIAYYRYMDMLSR